MSSTSQLTVGLKGKKDELISSWHSYNRSIKRGWRISNGGSAANPRHLSVCYSQPKTGWTKTDTGCRAHIDIRPVKGNPEVWEITSVDLNHICTADQSQRMRQVPTKYISKMSEAVSGYVPTASRKGNAKQLQAMVQSTTGMDMGKGQAHNHIRSLSHDELHMQIAQYYWLPSIFRDVLKGDDPDGTYILEGQQCRWDSSKQQFRRSYIAPSFTKHFWKHCVIRLIVGDGTFTRGNDFKHIVLLAVTFDAENKIQVLAAGLVPVENAEHWTWFHGHLRNDFPNNEVFMADADKGIRSDDFRLSQQQTQSNEMTSRCTQHLAKNCKENCGGTMNNEHKKQMLRLACSRTMAVYHSRLEVVRKLNSRWADWLDSRKTDFVAYHFLIHNKPRWGKVTSNGVENINSAILPVRYQPIAYLILELVMYMQDKYIKGKERASKLNDDNKFLTNYCMAFILKAGDDASSLPIRIVERNHPIYTAQVGIKPNAHVTQRIMVKVNVEEHTSECACLLYLELGIQCMHVCKLLQQLNQDITNWMWHHPRYHVTNYTEAYSLTVPTFTTAGRLTIDTNFVPPEHKTLPGRPKGRQDKMATYQHKTDQRRKCKSCGKRGHMSVRCTKPCTEYRVRTFEKQAVKWAKKQQQDDIQVDLAPKHDILGAYEISELESLE